MINKLQFGGWVGGFNLEFPWEQKSSTVDYDMLNTEAAIGVTRYIDVNGRFNALGFNNYYQNLYTRPLQQVKYTDEERAFLNTGTNVPSGGWQDAVWDMEEEDMSYINEIDRQGMSIKELLASGTPTKKLERQERLKTLLDKHNTKNGAVNSASTLFAVANVADQIGWTMQDRADATKIDLYINNIPGFGLVNSAFSKKTMDFSINEDVQSQIGGSYSGTSDLFNKASNNERVGLAGRISGAVRRLNKAKRKALQQQSTMEGIAKEAEELQFAAQSDLNAQAYNTQTLGGFDPRYGTIRNAKGGKLENKIDFIKSKQLNTVVNISTKKIEEVEVDTWEPVITFKQGGAIEKEWQPTIVLHLDGGKSDYNNPNKKFDEDEYPLVTIKEESWADNFFKQHPEVSGMAIGGGLNGIGGPRRVILNPYSKNINKESVIKNERLRHWMEETNFELPEISKELFEKYIGTPYENDTLNIGRTEAARYLSGDSSLLTPTLKSYILEFKQGLPKSFFKEVYDYYKDYDLSNAVLIRDNLARTEGNKIYVNTDEDAAHELWHFLSQNKPNKKYKEFYDNLNDDRITELGGDLNFVKRHEGDPGHFYHPSELEARIMAAKFKSLGLTYTKDFFKNLRSDENKYGYNMRDLLHMFNDENLEKIFNLKKGGTLGEDLETPEIEETTQKNVIPEGALHKNKHHIEHTEGLTQKGIPVIDNEGNLQAEVEVNELILTLEVTKAIEELYEIYYNEDSKLSEKDLAATEAGKILVELILRNTDDRTGLIDSIEV